MTTTKLKISIPVGQRIRTYFFAGILVTAPLFITGYVAWLFINFVDDKVTPLIPAAYNPETYLPFALPGLGLVVLFMSLTLVGMFMAGFMGRLFTRLSEGLLNRMPVIRSVYNAVKQVLETVLAQQSTAFREAVLVEYPRRGVWAIAFITGSTEGEVQNITEDDCVNIFLPTTPNPTSGFLLFVPKEDLISLTMSVEEAIKMVISGGIVTPPDRRSAADRNTAVTNAKVYEEVDVIREKDGVTMMVSKESRPGDKLERATGRKLLDGGSTDVPDETATLTVDS